MFMPKLFLYFPLLLSVVVVAAPQSSKKNPEEPSQSTKANQEKKDQSGPTSPSDIQQIRQDSKPQTQNSQSKEANADKQPHDWIDKLNAISTLIIAMFTLALFLVVLFQLKDYRARERAWIMVELEPVPGAGGIIHGDEISKGVVTKNTSFNVRIYCTNDGKAPAWITEKRACIDIANKLPTKPNWNNVDIVQAAPEPVAVGGKSKPKDCGLTCPKAKDSGEMIIIYGIIKYRDPFKTKRTTSFAYRLRIDDTLERLSGYPKYNEHT